MIVTRDNDEIFAAHCPQGDEYAGHDAVLKYSNFDALRKYALELFGGKREAEKSL
jgi:hypothetical protein